MHQKFAVYWRAADRQLFSFRQNIQAPSAQAAREQVRHALQRQQAVMVGVKQLAGCGRRCTRNGQWVG